MNKQLTLEEMQDAKAYPLTRPKPNPGMTWAEFARKVDKQKRGMPASKQSSTPMGDTYCEEIISIVKRHGPMQANEIIPRMSLEPTSVRQYLARCIAEGWLVDCGKKRFRKYRVPE